jgi:NAD(P)-dependent dehydrogenase (short-subunit alcohol dehydrogenase family)
MVDDKRKCALVTGGAQGIGRAIARRLLAEGWAVVIADLDREAGQEAVVEFAASGPCLFQPADVRREDDVKAVIAVALIRYGRLDALVNNAGIARARAARVSELALEDWSWILDTNLTGAFLCAKRAAPHLRAAKGAIVNIASTRALMSEPGSEAYAASKGGLVALTHALAISLGPEVRVNCVSPGWNDVSEERKKSTRRAAVFSAADHAQHPAGRVGRPDDIAAAVLYLLGDGSGFVTGANLVIDGGMTRKMIYV